MHFFRRILVKNIDAIQYINDWVKGLRICSSCAIATRMYVHMVLGKGSPDLSCMRARQPRAVCGGYRWRYHGYSGRQ